MPRPKLTEEEISAMRRRILDAAVSLLHEEGPGSLSIRAIAERVGVSHMALYSYFENRDDLFGAIREHHRRSFQARHADALARARAGSVEDVTAEVLAGYVTFARKNPHIYRFVWCTQPEAAAPREDCGKRLAYVQTGSHNSQRGMGAPSPARGLQEILNRLAELISLGIERGVFADRDPMLAARVAFGMIHGPLMLSLIPGATDGETLERLETEIVRAAMDYLTVQEEA